MMRTVSLICFLLEFKIYETFELLNHFTKMNPPCQMENSVFKTLSGGSRVRCGGLCDSNSFGRCGRFIWDQDSRTCMLHSNTIYPGTSSYTVTTGSGWSTYSETRKECQAVGYDYDLETNTCLKYMYKTAGFTWKEARARCQQDGGDLISILTKDKWDFVTNYIRCNLIVWIGLKDKTWVTGESFDNVFGISTQLNDYDHGFTSDTEHCARINLSDDIPLRDESCNIRKNGGFVCEIVLP